MVVIHVYMMIIMLSDHELVFTFISAHVVHHISNVVYRPPNTVHMNMKMETLQTLSTESLKEF